MVRTDLILAPEQYAEAPAYKLLEAAARGFIGVDRRFLHAILDDADRSIPDLVRFAAEDRQDDSVNFEEVLLDIFRSLRTTQALPYFIELVRRNPSDVSDELVESLVALGAAAVDPLLELLTEIQRDEIQPRDAGDLPFLVASLRSRDARILNALIGLLDVDVFEAAICLEMYGDPAAIPALEAALAKIPAEDAPSRQSIQSSIETLFSHDSVSDDSLEPFDIWPLYPETSTPEFEALTEEDRLAFLDSGSASLRAEAAASYSTDIPLEARALLLKLAKSDPDMTVRQTCWETLGEIAEEPEIRRAMLAVIANPDSTIQEKAGATVALARHCDNPVVFQAIENLYQDAQGRASALKAMGRSFDRRFAAYPPKHLEDPDLDIKTQAIWAIGYLNLSSEAPRLEPFFKESRFRTPALFAYALAIPGDTSRGRMNALLNKIEGASGGLDADEEDLVKLALDQRLMLHGHEPVFFPDETLEDDAETEGELVPQSTAKPGRNDPCSCGSGKKYKKCCGA